MKHIIKLSEQYGAQLRTRMMMEHIASSFVKGDDYLLDFSGIDQISRSAADELYTLLHSNKHISTVNMAPFVHKMLDTVTMGRFIPRKHSDSLQPAIVSCPTLQSVSHQLTDK